MRTRHPFQVDRQSSISWKKPLTGKHNTRREQGPSKGRAEEDDAEKGRDHNIQEEEEEEGVMATSTTHEHMHPNRYTIHQIDPPKREKENKNRMQHGHNKGSSKGSNKQERRTSEK